MVFVEGMNPPRARPVGVLGEEENVDLSPVSLRAGPPARSVTQRVGGQERSTMRSVALDLGVKCIAFCEIKDGAVVARRTVKTFAALSDVLGPESAPARVAVEACREAWAMCDRLRASGHEPILVDTTRVKALGIGQHGRKTDRIDAEVLARALEKGQIPKAHELSAPRRALRGELAVRRALIETRTQYITTVRGLIRATGKRLPGCATENFVTRFREAEFDEALREQCEPLLELLTTLEKQLACVDLKLERQASVEPDSKLLMTTPGVGLIVALMFIAVLDNAKRFRRAHQVESYVGLVPSEDSSGGKRRIGAISKCGNPYLRSLLVQSAQSILLRAHPDDPLRRWGEAVCERRGKRIAIVAIARRLVGILWAMWRTGTFYDGALLGRLSADALHEQAENTQARALAMKRASVKIARHVHRPKPTEGGTMPLLS